MRLNYNSNDTFISTGGNNLELNKPTICFVHGAGQNHFSFIQQISTFLHMPYIGSDKIPNTSHSMEAGGRNQFSFRGRANERNFQGRALRETVHDWQQRDRYK